jgi:hypothetical protein
LHLLKQKQNMPIPDFSGHNHPTSFQDGDGQRVGAGH